MPFAFATDSDGFITASVGFSTFDHALEDSISSRAPRGAKQGLSTYWIEQAEQGLRRAIEHGHREPFASGNVTYLRLEGDYVIAGYDFAPAEEDEAESIAYGDFLSLLGDWKARVIAAGGATGAAAMPPSQIDRVWKSGPSGTWR